MASLIPGYEYDIFISYRQKDNKGDRWVSEFVEALKTELESTFKEEISVYFDINPHDGLLETHDVDASLKDKLKCLIFIPIISRTYCDPKSFAWEHEFKAFINEASQDQFGLKVRLPGSNIANRVLPVQIHELSSDDRRMVKDELGVYMRGIEFIYNEPGVNRPLTSEDDEKKNLNNTKYRNQINKVANAISEVIEGLRSTGRINKEEAQVSYKENPSGKANPKTKIIAGFLILLALIIVGYYIISKLNKPTEQLEKSIAVLPFTNDSPSDSTTYFINGLMEEILNDLQKIKEFRVLSRTSTDQYKDKTRPTIPEIAKKLKVNYLVEGSGQKFGNRFILRVQLITANNERHLWGKSYDREIKHTSDIIDIQSEIARLIALELKGTITPEERGLIEKSPTTNLTAYDFYQRGKEEVTKYSIDKTKSSYLTNGENFYKRALQCDSTFALAYTGLALVNVYKHISEQYSTNYLDSFLILVNKALSLDDRLAEAHYWKAIYYWQIGEIGSVFNELDEALKFNPNYWEVYQFRGDYLYTYNYHNQDCIKAIVNYQKAISLNHGKEMPDLLRGLGGILEGYAGFHELGIHYYKEAYELDNDSALYFKYLANNESNQGNYEKAVDYYKTSLSINQSDFDLISSLVKALDLLGKYKEALPYISKYADWIKATKQYDASQLHRIGYCYWKNGNEKEAEKWFNDEKKFCQSLINNKRGYASLWLTSYYDLAGVYAFQGEKSKAYDNLNELKKMTVFPKWWLTLIKNDPLFDRLRNDKEFQDLVKDLEAKYQAEHDRVGKWMKDQGIQ